ncbi:MAG TPA: hypothetical protein VGQ99_24025 [Tepidisphaeraceae bacterium]|nr:hypothetical protein [Tepidisphaeraceae bacterium]
MKSGWMKFAVVAAAVGLVAVPVMALSVRPTKIEAKPSAGKVTKVSHVGTAKKPVVAAKPVVKNMSPRPASVRLGKNVAVKSAKSSVKTSAKVKPVMVTKTPVRPTTIHSGPAKLPVAKSTLGKAMERTRTVSGTVKTVSTKKPVNTLSKSSMN